MVQIHSDQLELLLWSEYVSFLIGSLEVVLQSIESFEVQDRSLRAAYLQQVAAFAKLHDDIGAYTYFMVLMSLNEQQLNGGIHQIRSAIVNVNYIKKGLFSSNQSKDALLLISRFIAHDPFMTTSTLNGSLESMYAMIEGTWEGSIEFYFFIFFCFIWRSIWFWANTEPAHVVYFYWNEWCYSRPSIIYKKILTCRIYVQFAAILWTLWDYSCS